ncbi:MAG TPA: type II secretion system F family protein [Verrucomicrobiae bacterium]|nr:type II secretion system F family protein [Verrucomicrobiae bacterium]
MPLRRRAHANLLLDLMLGGLRDAKTPEETIVSISRTRDKIVGTRFHLLAAYLEEGYRLIPALDEIPGYLPPNIIGLLRTGAETNQLGRSIQLAKAALGRVIGRTSSALQYAYVLVILLLPFTATVLLFWRIFVWPKMQVILEDMETPMPDFARLITENSGWFIVGYLSLGLCVLFLFIGAISGPRSSGNARSKWLFLRDRFAYALPWRNKLLKRDFSLILAFLLDAEMPEAQALERAGEGVGNLFVQWKARRAAKKLGSGLALSRAMSGFDEDGQLQWRLATAAQSGIGFVRALYGWHETLEGEASRQEETAAHLTSTALLILNGAAVACVMIAIFSVFIAVINTAVLW